MLNLTCSVNSCEELTNQIRRGDRKEINVDRDVIREGLRPREFILQLIMSESNEALFIGEGGGSKVWLSQ